jgi:hypothetical protein
MQQAQNKHAACRAASSGAASASASLVVSEPNLTRRMFEAVDAAAAAAAGGGQAGGAGGRTTLQALLAADQAWHQMRHMQVRWWLLARRRAAAATVQLLTRRVRPVPVCIGIPDTTQTGAAAGPAPTFVKTHARGQRLSEGPHVAAARASAAAGSSSGGGGGVCTYDVVVAGGTLGVFVAVALAQRGLSVAVVERGRLAGRTQEWNISRKEVQELVQVRRERPEAAGGGGGGRAPPHGATPP